MRNCKSGFYVSVWTSPGGSKLPPPAPPTSWPVHSCEADIWRHRDIGMELTGGFGIRVTTDTPETMSTCQGAGGGQVSASQEFVRLCQNGGVWQVNICRH